MAGRQMLGEGATAPAFRLRNMAGGETSLSELTAIGPVLLAFFKASCPTCQLAFPYLERLKDGNLPVVGISQDGINDTQEFVEEFHLSMPMLFDERKNGYPASNAYGISTVPSLFQVEADGTISHAWNGWAKSDMRKLGERAGKEVIRQSDKVPEFKPG
jgi:peroxiredoxin